MYFKEMPFKYTENVSFNVRLKVYFILRSKCYNNRVKN